MARSSNAESSRLVANTMDCWPLTTLPLESTWTAEYVPAATPLLANVSAIETFPLPSNAALPVTSPVNVNVRLAASLSAVSALPTFVVPSMIPVILVELAEISEFNAVLAVFTCSVTHAWVA